MQINFLFIIVFSISSCNADSNPPSPNASELIGDWNIIGIHNSTPMGPTTVAPEGETISLRFSDEHLVGNTSGNEFSSSYFISNESLTLANFATTEIADTVYGMLFYQALNESRDVPLDNPIFQIEFQENGNLHLIYNDFRFLILQRQE